MPFIIWEICQSVNMYSFGLGTGKRQIMRTEKDLVVKVGFKQARESMCLVCMLVAYLYVYVYMWVYVYVYVCMLVAYLFVYVYLWVYVFSVHVSSVFICVCVYVSVCVCMRAQC